MYNNPKEGFKGNILYGGKIMFKFTDKAIGEMKEIVRGQYFEDVDLAIELLRKFICIRDEKNFDQRYGQTLNEGVIDHKKWKSKEISHWEEFLGKMRWLKGKEAVSQIQMYTQDIGFFHWLSDASVQKARAKDPHNNGEVKGSLTGSFLIAEAEAQYYMDCPHYIYNYIMAYQFRNGLSHPGDITYISVQGYVMSMLIVYFDQCMKNRFFIERKYEEEMLQNNLDKKAICQKQLKSENGMISEAAALNFVQLNWKDTANNQIVEYSQFENVSTKFVGEAGSGKTTQMRALFIKELKGVISGQLQVLPVWIELKQLVKQGNPSISTFLLDMLELDQDDSILTTMLENGQISLYLDGFNEIIGKDNIIKKKNIASEIDAIKNRFTKVRIYMSDRRIKSDIRCLSNVLTCEISMMTNAEMESYARKYRTGEKLDKVLAYLHSDAAEWTDNAMIPEKMNQLMQLVEEGQEPDNEDQFYISYLEDIIERERVMNKEWRMDTLIYLLQELAATMEDEDDEMTLHDIQKLFRQAGGIGIDEANFLVQLAVELPIIKSGYQPDGYKFSYPQYYDYFVR